MSDDDEISPLRSSIGIASSKYGATETDNDNENDLKIRAKKEKIKRRAPAASLNRTRSSFLEDAQSFVPGSIPHSLVLGSVIGTVCGICAAVYYAVLFWSLNFIWHTLPQMVVVDNDSWPEHLYVLWIPIVGVIMALLVGLTVVCLGEPGDLPSTIQAVHEKAYIEMDHVMPMVCASQFSIVGGGSLGPEAPLVAICAAMGGFISRRIFNVSDRNLVRKHTLMGMSGALAAFFGCPLGGSLFALEVNSRFGIEYFEHTIEAIFSGEVCLAVFRELAGLPIESIWDITIREGHKLENARAVHVLYGLVLGLIGAFIAFLFSKMHQRVMAMFTKLDLLRNDRAVYRALLGSIVVVGCGMCIPATMFWGEFEFQTIATMDKASTLDHIWPTYGLFHYEMDTAPKTILLGFVKLLAISFTVAGGYRGGYIFPLMATGAAFGRAIHVLCPFIPVQLCCLCTAAGVNVGITRTAIATSLILAYLSGEQNAITALVASSFISLFVTGYMPFIKTQIVRSDLDTSLYYSEDNPMIDGDDEASESTRRNGDNNVISPIHGILKGFFGSKNDGNNNV